MQRREFLAATGAALLFPKKLATGVAEPIPEKSEFGFTLSDGAMTRADHTVQIDRVYCYFRFIDHH